MSGAIEPFLLEAGRALSRAGTPVTEIQERLTRIAAVNGASEARIVVMPTALLIAFERAGATTIESTPRLHGTMRLDQISALYEVVEEAECGRVDPAEGLVRLERIAAMPPRYGFAVTVLGYTVVTIGLCLILQPTLADIAIAGGLGLLVGLIAVSARGRQMPAVLIPIVCATLVSALTFEAVKRGWPTRACAR